MNMKANNWNRLLLVLVAGTGLVALVTTTGAATRGATWRFDAAENTNPEVNAGFVGASAQVATGENGLGWMAEFPNSTGATGTHDLGIRGRITADLAGSGVVGPAQMTVRVRQWFDGWIFAEFASIAVPGASLSNSSITQMTPSTVGNWITSEAVFEVPAGVVAARVEITGSANGAVVDEVTVSTTASLPEAPVLAIDRAPNDPGAIILSWAEAAGLCTVESSTTLGPAAKWTALDAPVQLTNGRYQVGISGAEGTRYFRLYR
jgi:hypothetical protein